MLGYWPWIKEDVYKRQECTKVTEKLPPSSIAYSAYLWPVSRSYRINFGAKSAVKRNTVTAAIISTVAVTEVR